MAKNVFLYIALAVLSLCFGRYLRIRFDRYNRAKLVKELEKYFGQTLPSFKKDKEKINWERVLKMLKEEPTTDQVIRWRAQVKKLTDKGQKK